MNKKPPSPTVLFFGRKGDEKSRKCLNHLNDLGFEVSVVWSSKRGETLPEDNGWVKVDYILCYRSYFILPKYLIDLPRFYSVNFHPGTPEYPGFGGINFSLYNNDKRFGVTVHLMDEKVDSGKILGVKYFPICENDNLRTSLNRTHDTLLNLFIEFSTNLREFGSDYVKKLLDENREIGWSEIKRTAKDIDKYQIVDKDVNEIELNNRIRSFNFPSYPIELRLHGKRFVLEEDED